jgi:2'-5' RNA ligase
MIDERWRCFVAVPLPEALRRDVSAAVDGWRDRPDLAGLRWSEPASWHVTLAFLGPVEPPELAHLSGRLCAMAAAHAPIRLRTAGVGGFPTPNRARVAWYGIADPGGALAALARDVRRAAGVEAGAFRGHITLARAGRDPIDLRAWIRDAEAPSGELVVDRIELMRSHLARGPARYEVLHSLSLSAAAHV